jgi:hypothetical protein
MTGALPTAETGEISRRDVLLASAAFLLAGARPAAADNSTSSGAGRPH